MSGTAKLVPMSVKAGVSAEEYLHTSYPDLDREYRDGRIVERGPADYLHSRAHASVGVFFEALRKKFSFYTCLELRLKLRAGLYLIPDVCVFQNPPPLGDGLVPDTPPFVVIEIFSRTDRMNDVEEKLSTFKNWGVTHVWLVNPYSKRMFVYEQGLVETPALPIPEFGLQLTPDDAFDA